MSRRSSQPDVVNDVQHVGVVHTDEKNMDDTLFPEGGWQAWRTIVGAFLVQFATFGYTNAFGVYQDFYVREYLDRYTPSQIGCVFFDACWLDLPSMVLVGSGERKYFWSSQVV